MRTSKTTASKSAGAKRSSTRTSSAPTNVQAQPTSYSQALPEPTPNADARQHMIAEAAYYRAEHRGFQPGYELEDWLAAEAEVVGHALTRSSSQPAS